MKFLFLADPLERLKPKGDSSFALLRAALARKHECYWAAEHQLGLRIFEPIVHAARVVDCVKDELPQLEGLSTFGIQDFEVVLIRKDPPFDESYLKVCWLLSLAEESVYMMNRPSLLLRFHEKLIPFSAVSAGILDEQDIIPTFISDTHGLKSIKGKIVKKPFLGFGGRNVSLLDPAEATKEASQNGNDLFQPFQPEIEKGDRRVFFLGGEILGHLVRMPAPGSFISNFAQGGSGTARALDPGELKALKKLGVFLKQVGIHLAGADVIGSKISEVNITSPTGLRSMEQLDKKDYAVDIVQFIERRALA